MAFLQRSRPVNARKRPPPIPSFWPRSTPAAVDPDPFDAIHAAAALLADAGCTLLVPPHQPPVLPSPHAFAARLARSLAADPDALSCSPPPRTRPASRALFSVPALQPGLLALLLEKLPEHFDGAALDGLPLQDDVGRLIVAQFRWLDFLVDADAFVEKLLEVLSVAPPRLKKEIIGSLPEIVGDQSHATVVSALEKLLQEDSEVVVADALSDLNLDEMLQDQAVTVAMSCVRTIAADQMPHLLRFLLLSATPANAGRIMLQIREQLKFVGVTYRGAASWTKKLKGKALASSTDGAILDTLRSGLRLLF
ncbi:hypothetical protein EJB05_28655, partial [Eragrostis curvula]